MLDITLPAVAFVALAMLVPMHIRTPCRRAYGGGICGSAYAYVGYVPMPCLCRLQPGQRLRLWQCLRPVCIRALCPRSFACVPRPMPTCIMYAPGPMPAATLPAVAFVALPVPMHMCIGTLCLCVQYVYVSVPLPIPATNLPAAAFVVLLVATPNILCVHIP